MSIRERMLDCLVYFIIDWSAFLYDIEDNNYFSLSMDFRCKNCGLFLA